MNLGPRGCEALERASFPKLLKRDMQLICSIGARHKHCRRAVCRRSRLCMQPRDAEGFFHCRYDDWKSWQRRMDVADKLIERLQKIADKAHAARGLPPPFAPLPPSDHLDLAKPFDAVALLAAPPEKEEEA